MTALVEAEAGWALDVHAFDPQRERVVEALTAVADGRVGVSGAPLAAHPAARPTALVAGVYDGEDAATHLLPAPIALQLAYDLTPEPVVHRLLDHLRSGVLHERETTTAGELTAVRFACLARPGTVVVRALCPDGHFSGAAVAGRRSGRGGRCRG